MSVPDKDVHISLEDQQKINKFARHNQKLEDIKDDLKAKENEIVTLSDAANDVEELSLTAEEEEKIPYMVGEIFVMETPDDVVALLEKKKEEVKAEMAVLEDQATAVKAVMSDLKTNLYAKFGDAINLEADE